MPSDHGLTTVPPASHPDSGSPVVQQSSVDGLSMLSDDAARGGFQAGRLDRELFDVRYLARTATRTKRPVGYQ